ncbi:DUF1192 domain-containing protein [Methylocella sp.]|uniref:DUF1192 domain-containing protein n=1 Tax=Methylocella sp. TaxID=1978226 RepID=UPI003783DA08
MIADDEGVFAPPPRRPPAHEIGQALDDLSAHQLDERIALLRAEIARLEAAREAKRASKQAAAAFFKI